MKSQVGAEDVAERAEMKRVESSTLAGVHRLLRRQGDV